MLAYKNILIAVDGSDEAEWAFNKAVDVAKRNDAKLTIVHVIDTRTYILRMKCTHLNLTRLKSILRSYLKAIKNLPLKKA